MKLIALSPLGAPLTPITDLPRAIEDVLDQTRSLYERERYEAPWISYVGVEGDRAVGLGAFKSAPREGRVEIAYMTAPQHEGRGVATAIARELIALARRADPQIDILAQTLREENASVAILRKLGFDLTGDVLHPEDGWVWEWRLAAG
ncbi:MAG: GNAT family N-acetyltransferase [Parvularculaceae bacterium]